MPSGRSARYCTHGGAVRRRGRDKAERSASMSTICARPPTAPPRRAHHRHRADQHPRHPGLFLNYQGPGGAHHRADRCGQPPSCSSICTTARSWRAISRTKMRGSRRTLPARPDRRQSRAARAQHRGDQLPVSVRPVRRTGYAGLDRLRGPAEGPHRRRARLGEEIRDHCLTKVRSRAGCRAAGRCRATRQTAPGRGNSAGSRPLRARPRSRDYCFAPARSASAEPLGATGPSSRSQGGRPSVPYTPRNMPFATCAQKFQL